MQNRKTIYPQSVIYVKKQMKHFHVLYQCKTEKMYEHFRAHNKETKYKRRR